MQFPTPGCDMRAAIVDSLSTFQKAVEGYALDRNQSAAACAMGACAANGQIPSSEHSSSAPHRLVPLEGWGRGPSRGRAWMARTSLAFNRPALSLLSGLELQPGEALLLVFGGAAVSDMLRNWALHVRRLKMPFVVAAMDVMLFDLAESDNMPAVLMRERSGAQSVVKTKWKYYRMDPKAFMAMGIIKVNHTCSTSEAARARPALLRPFAVRPFAMPSHPTLPARRRGSSSNSSDLASM